MPRKCLWEYIDCCLSIGDFYSFLMQPTADGEDEPQQPQFFLVLGKPTSTHKPKLLKTHGDDEDLYADSTFVIELHMMDIWMNRGGGLFSIFFDDCPVMLSPF